MSFVKHLIMLVVPEQFNRENANFSLNSLDQQGFEVLVRITHASYAKYTSMVSTQESDESLALLELLHALEFVVLNATKELATEIMAQQPFDPLILRIGLADEQVAEHVECKIMNCSC